MEPQKGHHPSHGRPSSSQDYRYPPPSTHHFPPGPGSTFHHHAYTASLIAAGHPEQQQQAAVLQQRDIITRLPPRIDNRSYQQAELLPGNMDTLDQQRTDTYKKQALNVNPYFYHPNFAVTSSVALDNIQSSLGVPKECPPNLVIGSAIAMDNAPSDNSHVVTSMDIASSTSSPSTCTSLQTPNNPEAPADPTTNVDLMAQRDAVIAGSAKEPSAAETAELLRLKYAPKANSLIQTLLRKGGQPPDGLSYDQFTSDPNDVRILATKPIEQGKVYGPLQGNVKTLDCLHNTQAWELCLNGMVAAYIAPTPRKEWMGYVRNARFREECNLEAGQVYGRIHFTVIRRIEPGSELRVFYSDVYRENCGFMYDLTALNYKKDADSFSCTMCNVKIDNSKSMVRHYKVTHPDDGLQEEKSLPLKVAERLKHLNAQCKLPPQYEEEEEEGEETPEDTNEATEKNNDDPCPISKVKEEPPRKNVQSNQSVKRKMQDVSDSQRFICPTCGKNFPTHGRLMMHESFHDADNEVDNGMDDDIFDDNDPVGNGVGGGLRCSICGFNFDDEDRFAIHKKKHKTHRFMCKQCGNLYVRKTYMYRHQREVHGAVYVRPRRSVNSFLQNYTSAKAPRERSITSVLLDRGKESKNAANRCNICNYMPRSRGSLREHTAQHRDKPYGCEKCGLVYAGRSHLYKHLRLKHGASKERFLTPHRRESIMKYLADQTVRGIRCKECGFTCRDKKSLEEHRQTHRGTRRASNTLASRGAECCEICGFKPADEDMFNEHMHKHDMSPFGCRKCGNTYMTKKSLVRHHHEKHADQNLDNKHIEQTVIQKKTSTLARHKDACPHCAFYTPDKADLQKHISKHPHFPHGCIECGHVYTRKTTLIRHQRLKHVHLLTGQGEGSNKDEISGLLQSVTLPENLRVQGNNCPRCGFHSPDKNFLTDHVILHLTHPHGCNVCGNVYTKSKFMIRHMREKHPEAFGGDGDVASKEGDLSSASDVGEVDDESGDDESGDDAEDYGLGSGEDNAGEFGRDGNDYYGRDDGLDGEEEYLDREEAEMEGEEEYSDKDESAGNEDEYDDEEVEDGRLA